MYAFIFTFLFLITSTLYGETTSLVTIPEVIYRDGVYCITLDETTPYRRGCQHGAALRVLIKKTVQKFIGWIQPQLNGIDPEDLMEDFLESTPYLECIERYVPDLLEEISGIAYGAQIPLHTLFAYQNFEEFIFYLSNHGINVLKSYRDGTTIALYKRENQPSFLGQNFDLPECYEGAVTAVRIIYPDGFEIIQHGLPGQIGVSGVNINGIAVSGSTLKTTFPFHGVPLPMVARKLLEEKDIRSIEQYLNTIPTTASHYTILDKDGVVSIDAWELDRFKHIVEKHRCIYTSHTTKEAVRLATLLLQDEEKTMYFNQFKEIFQLRPIMQTMPLSNKTGSTMLAIVSKEGKAVLYIAADAPLGMPYVPFQFVKKVSFLEKPSIEE